jgi:hypothetical protein
MALNTLVTCSVLCDNIFVERLWRRFHTLHRAFCTLAKGETQNIPLNPIVTPAFVRNYSEKHPHTSRQVCGEAKAADYFSDKSEEMGPRQSAATKATPFKIRGVFVWI